MHPVIQYILGCLGAVVIGAASAAIVFSISWVLNRWTGMRIEMTFALAGLFGLALMFAGNMLGSRALSAASILLCGWIVLPILLIPPIMIWRFVAWCRRRLAA